MVEITPSQVEEWSRLLQVGSLRLAEQDLRLTSLLDLIGSDEGFPVPLAFKGGTALNKLYFEDEGRLSVDLDFNALGSRDSVQQARGGIRARLFTLVRELDPTSLIHHDHTWGLVRVAGRYDPVSGGKKDLIKVEVSMVERFPITPLVRKRFDVPGGGSGEVATYGLDELISTKLRAFYSRRKGRDLYDLVRAGGLLGDPRLLRRMAVYHFYRTGALYIPEDLRANFEEKLGDPEYLEESRLFLREGRDWNAGMAVERFRETYGFLYHLEPREREFISLARHLLGKVGRGEAGPLLGRERPVADLFDGFEGVTDDARSVTLEEIMVRSPSGKKGQARG